MNPTTLRITFSVLILWMITMSSLIGQQRTYCNPVNLDYGYCPIPDFVVNGRHRTSADPVIVLYKGDYYLFATNQQGYWWSADLQTWHYVSHSFLRPYHHTYDDLCAPAAFVANDTLFLIGSTYTKDFPLWMSTNPKDNVWETRIDSFKVGAWDPAFFVDDDKKWYLYYGSSNVYPIYGVEINRSTYLPVDSARTLAYLNYERYGWQRFGEYFDNIFLEPFIEGAWMNKFNGKYYLQFATPGTEFSGYADGVMIAENPLGPFVFQKHNPFSSKLGGFIRGAGHGATFYDKYGNLWHVATGVISVKNNFERRIGLWPAGVDKDGVLYCNTTFGDFPHFIPQQRIDCPDSLFTGWMLLNFNKPVQVSSTFGGYVSNYAVDEDIKTFWSATTGNKGEWIVSDMGDVCTVFAVQINYADMDAQFMGKINDIYHQYIVYASSDGKQWKTIIDKSNNTKDIPHDYVELPTAVKARYLKLLNLHVPSGKFAISGFRIFGKGNGFPPDSVKNFIVLRTQKDKRSAWIKWSPVDNAYAYNIYVGTAPDKLYTSIMVYGKNEYFYKSMDKDISYYFTIVAINENGVSSPLRVVKVE